MIKLGLQASKGAVGFVGGVGVERIERHGDGAVAAVTVTDGSTIGLGKLEIYPARALSKKFAARSPPPTATFLTWLILCGCSYLCQLSGKTLVMVTLPLVRWNFPPGACKNKIACSGCEGVRGPPGRNAS